MTDLHTGERLFSQNICALNSYWEYKTVFHTYIFSKNICIVYRLLDKLSKSKRLRENTAQKFATVQKTQNIVLCWRGLCLQGVVNRKTDWCLLCWAKHEAFGYQAISLESGLTLIMRIYPVSKIDEISMPKGRNFIRVRESTLRRGRSCWSQVPLSNASYKRWRQSSTVSSVIVPL